MSLAEGDNSVELIGDCGLEDAEPLLRRLLDAPATRVEVRNCRRLHAAVLQVLLASRAEVRGPFAGRFLHEIVEPLLQER